MTELLTDPGHIRQDLRQIESAVRKGWVIPEQLLEALPRVAGAMALKGKPRDQIAAMKVLLAMKEQNEKPEPTAPPPQTVVNVGVSVTTESEQRRGRLIAIAERIKSTRMGVDAVAESDTIQVSLIGQNNVERRQ